LSSIYGIPVRPIAIPVNTIDNICDLAWKKAGITAANISNRIAETLFCLLN